MGLYAQRPIGPVMAMTMHPWFGLMIQMIILWPDGAVSDLCPN